MSGTMTFVAFDVHAQSIHAAAIDAMSGELTRVPFTGGAAETTVAWRGRCPGCVWSRYEAGPTGFGLNRAAVTAGIRLDVIAPGGAREPVGGHPGQRSRRQAVPGRKTDVTDAHSLCRLAEAGLLRASFVPPKPIRTLNNL